jgi:hypothetical protein
MIWLDVQYLLPKKLQKELRMSGRQCPHDVKAALNKFCTGRITVEFSENVPGWFEGLHNLLDSIEASKWFRLIGGDDKALKILRQKARQRDLPLEPLVLQTIINFDNPKMRTQLEHRILVYASNVSFS